MKSLMFLLPPLLLLLQFIQTSKAASTICAPAPSYTINITNFDNPNITLGGWATALNPSGGSNPLILTNGLATSDEGGPGYETYTSLDPQVSSDTQVPLAYGQAFYNAIALPSDYSFSTYFEFVISNNTGIDDPAPDGTPGSDGLAFIVQANGANEGPAAEPFMFAYYHQARAVAVEYDTFMDTFVSDPDGNHVGIDINADIKSAATSSVQPLLNSGSSWYTWVDYSNSSSFSVYLSLSQLRPPTPTLQYAVAISTMLGSNSQIWVGFGASTRLSGSRHQILDWKFNVGYNPIQVLCNSGQIINGSTCVNCPAGTYSPDPSGYCCQICTPGTYASAGAAICQSCPGYQYSLTQASSCSNCTCVNGICDQTQGTCLTCNIGWTGTNCSTCASGYYGSNCTSCPSCQHGTCNGGLNGNGTCSCNGNWILSGGTCSACLPGFALPNCQPCTCVNGICNQNTGSCYNCTQGWSGGNCTTCASGYYGSTCTSCPNCNNGTCNSGLNGNGTCSCYTGWTGTNCNTCASGYYGPSCLTCPNCQHGTCNSGLNGNGACSCNGNWTLSGGTCSACLPGFALPNCQPCTCVNGICDQTQGTCLSCNTGWNGTNCNTCLSGYYGPNCTACPSCQHGTCNNGLSGNGLCSCALGWNGTLCSSCTSGYYGSNCTSCPNCGHGTCSDGSNGSGACICSGNWTTGDGFTCETCLSGFAFPNCQPCTCQNGVCNQENGTCNYCNTGWTGVNCDSCSPGYYGANCTACVNCSQGICNDGLNSNGSCSCSTNWTTNGAGICNKCITDHALPNCQLCTCQNGICAQTQGTCLSCNTGWAGVNCDSCSSGYYGSNCTACPICSNGSCIDGLSGDGSCSNCSTGFVGNCSICASGYYGSSCLTCPNCQHGSCNDGNNGDGSCICSGNWQTDGSGNCTICIAGYALPNCQACTCEHGICNQTDGYCSSCNTGWTGANCDSCLSGFYGSSCLSCPDCVNGKCLDGISGDGKCACNGNWEFDVDGNCTICPSNWNGSACNSCASGYYGSSCTACPNCQNGICFDGLNGNGTCSCSGDWILDSTGLCTLCKSGYALPDCQLCSCEHGICDQSDGSCITCYSGFTGSNCSTCTSGYYGSNCTTCPNCQYGSCNDGNNGDGSCSCTGNWTTDSNGICDVCLRGFALPYCNPCTCVNGICNQTDGLCSSCFIGWSGSNCDSCSSNYYGSNCTACPDCDHGTCTDGINGDGSCSCTGNWQVDNDGNCTSCKSGFALPNCQTCTCVNGICDQSNGSCSNCNLGWSGINCDVCANNYYGAICQVCPNCGEGTCNEGINGDGSCICNGNWIINSNGNCTSCKSGFALPDCQPCTCVNGICDQSDGYCAACYSGFTGSNCDSCLAGYYGPSCTPCIDCQEGTCEDGITGSGNCTCNGNFAVDNTGACEVCKQGYTNPPYCTPCVCLNGACDQTTGHCISCYTGWVGTYCDVCNNGYYGHNCTTCIQCGNGRCNDGSTGNGSCICNENWVTNSDGTCTLCEYGYYGAHCLTPVATPTITAPPPSQITEAKSGLSQSTGIIIGVIIAIAVILLLVVVLLYVHFRRTPNWKEFETVPMSNFLVGNRPSDTLIRSKNPDDLDSTVINTRLEVALPGFLRLDFASQLRVETALGIGGSGTLSTGVLLDIDLVKKYNTSKVALKFIQGISKLSEEENQQLFNREVSIMWSLNFNPNIAMLLGYTENPPCIVIKLYGYDLYALIHVDQTRLSLMEKILIFRDVARGLAGMHELNICHRDIKSANVLIDNEMVNGKEKKKAVICDFGLAAADESIIAVETGMKETYVQGFSPRYAAPEIFAKAHAQAAKSNTIQVNTEKAGDVYAFGVIVWEVLVEKIPWEGLTLEEIEMEVRQGNRPSPLPQVHESNEIYLLTGLMKRCWSASPQERPSMVDVQSKLDIIAQDD